MLAKFRLSSHNLHIETGRHHKPKTPIELRTCMCDNTQVEDEIHLLLNCPFYNNIRCKFFNNIFKTGIIKKDCMSEFELFAAIMSCKDNVILNLLGKYICQCFSLKAEKSLSSSQAI
jgi:hypothetical protein